jgi:GT2 family glycosyltransferase
MPTTTSNGAAPGPAVTVVVATRDRPVLLAEALTAIRRSLRDEDRLVVVDSASRDQRVRAVAEASEAAVLHCEVPGACRARNVGWREASTQVVAFTDDDCLPAPDWVSAISAAFWTHPGAAFVTGRVILDEPISSRMQLGLSIHDEAVPAEVDSGSDATKIGHGANMAWRREDLEVLGGFDEGLGPGTRLLAAEDHDLFWRALQAGMTGAYDPLVVVRHRQWRGRRDQLRTAYGYGVGAGALAVKQWRVARATGLEDQVAAMPMGAGLRPAARELAWQQGLARMARSAGDRYAMGVLSDAVKLAGSLRGASLARALPIRAGHYRATL